MSTEKRKNPRSEGHTNTPKPQKQWDEMPRTSDPEEQQIERVIEEENKKGPKGNAGEVARKREQEKKDSHSDKKKE